MFRSLPLFLNGVLLLAVLGSAACSHCEATFVVPEDAQYWCLEDTGSPATAFRNRCEEGEDPFGGCSPRERCKYPDVGETFCGYCLPREKVQNWIDEHCSRSCWIEKDLPRNGEVGIDDDAFYIKCK
ncbi:MAG TPA: hypothetical protein PKY30_08090 [Myxococcota bacterium]|nr:hypothetical protein [Myxococcota bacterium]HNH46982.1 hypothetical protein [Myxococcota bacterium]